MPGISYDESGSLAGYFGVTFLAVVLVPATYIVFKPAKKEPLQPLCNCEECRSNFARIDARKSSVHRKRFFRRILPLLVGWLLFAYLAWTIAQAPRGEGSVVYNPFEILGIGSQSTEKQIKKHYKKLSLQFHPDKIKLAENQTMEDAEAHFVEITKAYKSLTDEVTRENLAKYGNPDGPQQREDKIAIPQWVVEGKNSAWVLGAYGLFLGVGIPFVVGRWWFSQRRHTRDGILTSTAEHFFYHVKDDTDFSNLLTILAGASEFATLLAASTGRKLSKKDKKAKQAKVEELEKVIEMRKQELGVAESPTIRQDSKVAVGSGPARRARALLWAHVLQVELDNAEMRSELDSILRESQPLLNSLLNISLAHSWLKTTQLCVALQAALVQALPPGVSPLSQLPGLTPEIAEKEMVIKGAEGKRWLEKWVKKSSGEKAASDDVDLDRALHVAKTWPRLEIVSAEFKVEGEKVVPPSSIASLAFRVRYVYPTTPSSKPAPAPAVKEEEANGESHAENGEAKPEALVSDAVSKVADAVKDEKKDISEKVEHVKHAMGDAAETLGEKAVKIGRKGKEADELAEKTKVWPPTGYAHAPHWPLHRKPHFQVLLGDSKLDKVIVPPIKITDIPLPRADGLPSEPREFVLQFPAPPQPNLYSFVLYALSDTFLGADADHPMMLKVEEPPADASDDEDEDDISEPEEDTLAGQMAMMRGGKVKPSAVHGGGDDDDDDDDEDGSEYESSSDEEGPANRRKKAINEDSDSDDD